MFVVCRAMQVRPITPELILKTFNFPMALPGNRPEKSQIAATATWRLRKN